MIPVSRPSLGQEELRAVGEVFATGWVGLGTATYAFEEALSRRFNQRQVIAVNTGTSALHIALAALGLGAGDEVIVPSLTFAASIQAIIATGATPVFCEVEEDTLLLDVEDAARRITTRTRAIMPVHYAGQACEMDRLLALAHRAGAKVVEDAAHAFGSTYHRIPVGGVGDVTCFSFDPIKTITCGEGGAVVTEDVKLAERIRRMRQLGIDRDTWQRYKHARSWYYEVTEPGFRYHMPNFCAAVGLAQLQRLETIIARRRAICRRYDEAFQSLKNVRPLRIDYAESAPQLYVVQVAAEARDAFMAFLEARQIGTGIHYLANHRQPYFSRYAQHPLPRTERLCDQIVSLPLYTDLAETEVQTVIDAVTAWEQQPTCLA